MTMLKSQVAIIGAGPAGLMAAEVLAGGGAAVTVYDAMPSAGRKLLMAGRGGRYLSRSEGLLAFLAPDGKRAVDTRATVLTLGGASWPRLGSDGAWVQTLTAKQVAMSPLRPANCGFTVAWSDIFRDRFEGQPLKGVAVSFGAHMVRGEAM